MRIAILIPCFNESQTIGKVVQDFKCVLPNADIYVYDNNSTDDTAAVAMACGAIVRHEPRQGKGNVIRRMFLEIEADCFVMVDGDDTYPAEAALDMCKKIEAGFDMVIGDRLSTSYSVENKRPFHNLGNKLVRHLVNRIFHSELNDIMTGYRAMSKGFVRALPVLSQGFEVETEMTIFALDMNFAVCQEPIAYRDRQEGSVSKLSTYSDGWKVLKTICLLFRDYKPFQFFSIVALLVALGSAFAVAPVLAEYFETGLVPRFPTLIVCCFGFLISVLLWLCGLILDVLQTRNRQQLEILSKLSYGNRIP